MVILNKPRKEALAGFSVLDANPAVEHLSKTYITQLNLPDPAIRDAIHLAFACFYEIDFLITWNCAHIANGEIIRKLTQFNADAGFSTPTICTPEGLLEERDLYVS